MMGIKLILQGKLILRKIKYYLLGYKKKNVMNFLTEFWIHAFQVSKCIIFQYFFISWAVSTSIVLSSKKKRSKSIALVI